MTPADHNLDRKAFQHVVNKLSIKDGFMAQLLRLAFGGDVSAARIARELGCSEDAALRLAMMRSPAVERDSFRRDVTLMADDIGIDVALLSATVRQARALSAFEAPAASNMLMAARDHLGDDKDR
jgi:hypothetical protein